MLQIWYGKWSKNWKNRNIILSYNSELKVWVSRALILKMIVRIRRYKFFILIWYID